MKPLFFLLFAMMPLTGLFAQFQVGHRQQTFTDPARSNRSIAAEIYYPAATTGNNVAISTGQFPILVFGHGFVMTWDAYNIVWNALVPEGYIMVFPTTESSFSPSHSNFGQDLAFLVNAMKAEGANTASPFYGSVAASSAVMGHSMGGGASFLAAEYDTTITTIVTFAAAVTTPSSTLAARNVRISALVIAGANDCVAPPAQHQSLMYDSLSSDCKTYISITGASHCQFASTNTFCSIGEATCTPAPTISRATQQSSTFALLLPWLDYKLKSDTTAATVFQGLVNIGTGITSMQNCTFSTPSATSNIPNFSFSIFPNPFSQEALLKTTEPLIDATLVIYNSLGQVLYKRNNLSGTSFTIDGNNFPKGLYFINVFQGNKLIIKDKIISTN